MSVHKTRHGALAEALRAIGKPVDPDQLVEAARAAGKPLPVEAVHTFAPTLVNGSQGAICFNIPPSRHAELAALVDQLVGHR